MPLCSQDIDVDLEPLLNKWSVESTLATLFGDAYKSGDCLDFVKQVHDMFNFTAKLALKDVKTECDERTEDWEGFDKAANSSLNFFQEKISAYKV